MKALNCTIDRWVVRQPVNLDMHYTTFLFKQKVLKRSRNRTFAVDWFVLFHLKLITSLDMQSSVKYSQP